MRYSELANVYEELENTSARLKKTDIISELLKKTPTHELEKLVSLLAGRIFPIWSEEETGVANQIMIRAIAKSSGIEESLVNKTYKKIGDLGKVAEELCSKKKQKTLLKKTLDIEKVYENMLKISEQGGKGSQDRKINLIVELLSQANAIEAKYIVRIVLEELRIGVAEGVIRDSIAKAFDVNPKDVENAWFLESDYGKIARLAKEHGEHGLKSAKIEIGTPIMPLLAVKAASLEEAMNDAKEPALEYKYDGLRAQIHKKGSDVYIFTRRQENVTNAFPDLVELCKKCIRANECIIEGEVLAVDPKKNKPIPFQKMSQRIRRKYDIEQMVKEIPIQINVFDIVYLNGKMLLEKTQRERRRILEENIKEIKEKFQLSQMLVTKDLKKAEQFYQEALKAGQEGVMVKNLDAYYQPERHVGFWWKVKPILETLDLVIIGGTWGTGKRAGWIGSYTLGCREANNGEFLECGMLGSGLKEKKTETTDVTMEDLTKLLKPFIEKENKDSISIKPKLVIEVAYEEIQKSPTYKSGFALRFPRLVRIRFDRAPREADTIDRLNKIYAMQKGKK